MRVSSGQLTETNVIGQSSVLRCLGSSEEAERPWLEGQPVCTSLAHYQILHLGIAKARYPYEMIRSHQGGAYFLVTLRGQGRILINGRWSTCQQGQACLLPAYTANAFHCIEGEEWDFCWVRYRHPQGQLPLIAAKAPILENFSTEQFHAAIQGILFESELEHREIITAQWAQLIHIYVREFVAPHRADDLLWPMWNAIENALEEDWTLDRMTSEACLSGEHLRRLCKAQYGRSPIQQIRWMRMQRAAELLLTTDYKIESIGYDVGYKNPAVFSKAFAKHFALLPSEYRSKQAAKKH